MISDAHVSLSILSLDPYPAAHTVLVCDHARGLANSLFGLLNNMVWRFFGPANDDGALGSGGHGEGSEERDDEGK